MLCKNGNHVASPLVDQLAQIRATKTSEMSYGIDLSGFCTQLWLDAHQLMKTIQCHYTPLVAH